MKKPQRSVSFDGAKDSDDLTVLGKEEVKLDAAPPKILQESEKQPIQESPAIGNH